MTWISDSDLMTLNLWISGTTGRTPDNTVELVVNNSLLICYLLLKVDSLLLIRLVEMVV